MILIAFKITRNTTIEKFEEMMSFKYDKHKHEPNKLSLCESDVACVTYKNKGLQVTKENKPYLFIHIPKNAGTYVRKIMPGMNGGHDHVTMNDIKKKMPEMCENVFSFAILRNPWERCVSMYNFHVNTDSMDIKGWGKYGMDILTKKNVNTFEDFVDLLYKHKNNIRGLGEIVWEKQVHFVTDNHGAVIVDQLIKIENLEQELNEIKTRFGITIPNPSGKINVSNSKDYRLYYNDRTKSLVEEIYKEDIALTGYTF